MRLGLAAWLTVNTFFALSAMYLTGDGMVNDDHSSDE